MFLGKLLDEQNLGALRCLLIAIILFNASVQAFEVFDLTPITHRNQLNVSTATKRYLTPEFCVAYCCMSANSMDQTSFSRWLTTLSLGKLFLVSLNFVSFTRVQVAINMLGWAFSTSEHFFATAKSRWVIRVCVGIVNLSICNCKRIIIFNQNSTFRTFCAQKVIVVVGFAFQTGTIEVNPVTHVEPQRRASFQSFTWPFLTASPEPFLRRHLSKIKLRLWAICWDDQCQVWYVFAAILRSPTHSEFCNPSACCKCLPTEVVEGQVSRPNWGIAWPIVWCSLGARLQSQLYLLLCLVDRQQCFDCSHQCWLARFSGLTSSFAQIVRFYLQLFQIEVGCLELVWCNVLWAIIVFVWDGYLCIWLFFWSWSLEFKSIWAISACSLSIARFVTASLFFWRRCILMWCRYLS